MASVAMLSPQIKEEPDVLPRASVFPKRKPGLSTISTRSRFVKARPNISVSNKTPKDAPASPSGNNSTSENISPEPIEIKTEPLQRPALPKRTAGIGAAPRARFQKARPNIGSLLSKNSKDSHSQKEKTALPPDDAKNVESSNSSLDVAIAVENDSVSNTDSISVYEPSEVTGSLDINEVVKSPVKVTETPKTYSASTPKCSIVISDEEKSSDTECTLISQCKDSEISSNERTTLDEHLEKDLPVEVSPAWDIEDNSASSSRTTSEVSTLKESPPSTVTVNKNVDYPTLKSILNSPRKRTATKKTHERRKRLANLSSAPSRSEMTMLDLIYWNPNTSPMKVTKPATGPREEDLLPPDENTGASLPPEESDDFNSAPKVIINADGEIILDESSLVVRRKDTVDRSKEAIIENDHTTYSSFRKRSVKTWSKKETAKFYKALSLVGTDFALMESMFQSDGKVTRTRRELKLKFKREEKLHTNYVHTAIYELQTYDLSILDDDDSDEMAENSEIVDDAPKKAKKPIDTGTKNPSGRGRKKKSVLPEPSVDETHSTTEIPLTECTENTSDAVEIEDGEVEMTDLKESNEATTHENAPILKSTVLRPERTKKAKTLTDFVTDLKDFSDTNDGTLENEEESLLPRRKRKVQVLSEESEDTFPETVDKTDKMNELVTNPPEDNVNTVQNVVSKDAEITHEKGPLPVKRRRKLQIMPKINQNHEENSQNVPTEVSETMYQTSRSGRKRKMKNMSDFITDPDALSEVDDDIFDPNTEYLCEKKRSGHFKEIVPPETETEEIEVAVNSISCNESSSMLTSECIDIPSTKEQTEFLTEKNTFCTSADDKLNHPGSSHQNDKNLTIEPSNITNMDNLDNPDVICLSVSPSKEAFSVISSEKSTISNVLNLPDSKACSSISVNNLLTDAVISEVVTSDKRTLRTRKRTVLPNVVKGSKRPGVFQKKQPSLQPSFTSFTPVDEEIQQPISYSKYPRMVTSQNLLSSPLHVSMETSDNNYTMQEPHSEVTITYSASPPNKLRNPSNSTFASTEILTISDENDASPVSSTNTSIHSSTLPEISKSVNLSRANSVCMLEHLPQTSADLALSVPLIDSNSISMTPEHNSDSSVVILTQSPNNENILHVFMCQKP